MCSLVEDSVAYGWSFPALPKLPLPLSLLGYVEEELG